jgi:hypothetical protein
MAKPKRKYTEKNPTNVCAHNEPESNMYDCLPCPKCKGRYRYPTQPVHSKHPNSIICDDCGHVEPMDEESWRKWGYL